MRVLKAGSWGPSVQLLQLALNRADFGPLKIDGIFGSATGQALRSFQASAGLTADGIAGAATHRALLPWYTGFVTHRVHRGESLSSIAELYGSSLGAVFTANPDVQTLNLPVGSAVTVPLPFPVVPTEIAYSSALAAYCVRGLAARYPFIVPGEIGRSVMGRPIWSLTLGDGANRVLYNATHHANEWICTPLLLKFTEELAQAYANSGTVYGSSAAELLSYARLSIIPCLNPDGMDLVTGELQSGPYFSSAAKIAADYPRFSFPDDWKANIRGVDLNLQYPAGWAQAKAIKFSQGIRSPAPADFVGSAALSAPESRALYQHTLSFDPALILAYHTQGKVIFWRYLDFEPTGSRRIGALFAEASGYALEETPYSSGFAGYKDWFIQDFDRPGYTIEAGLGVNPLPLSDFDGIYRENLGILTLGALVT